LIGEFFIDTCISLGCSVNDDDAKLLEVIQSILSWHKKETQKDDVPIEFLDKVELANYLINYRMNNKPFDFKSMVYGLKNGKLKNLIPIVENSKTEIAEEELEKISSFIYSKKKLCDMITGRNNIQELLTDVETGNYIDDDEICERWEHQITNSYTQITEINRIEAVKDVASLDLLNDEYDEVERSIRERYSSKNVIKTGYKSVDNLLPAKGFERGRLYVIGGTSGIGKSNFMINLIVNAISQGDPDPDAIYLYLTGENLIGESLERTYCCFTRTPHKNMVDSILNDPTFSLKKEITNILTSKSSNIHMKYIKPDITTSFDVAALIADVNSKGNLKAVYLDYLDLTCSGYKIDDIRLDIGRACRAYKNLAVDYKIPFITATQLNRSGYDKELEPSLISMSESMKKVHDSDFVLFLQPPTESVMSIPFNGSTKSFKKVKMTVLKNRNGEVGASTNIVSNIRLGDKKIFDYSMEEEPETRIDIVDTNIVDENYDEYTNNVW